MSFAPLARIIIRYGAGLVFGSEAAELAVGDADLVSMLAVAIAAGVSLATEFFYSKAIKHGWAK